MKIRNTDPSHFVQKSEIINVLISIRRGGGGGLKRILNSFTLLKREEQGNYGADKKKNFYISLFTVSAGNRKVRGGRRRYCRQIKKSIL